MRSKRFFMRIMLVFCCALILTLGAVLATLNTRIITYMEEDIYDIYKQMVATNIVQFDGFHQQTNMAASIMLESSDIKNAFYGHADHSYDRFAINNRIRAVQAQFPYIDSISIVDTRHQFYYNSYIISDEMLQADIADFFGQANIKTYCFLPRNAQTLSPGGDRLISMVIPAGYKRRAASDGAKDVIELSAGIVINARRDYFFGAGGSEMQGSNGTAILSNHELLCYSSLFDADEVERVVAAASPSFSAGSGHLNVKVGQNRYLVSYHTNGGYTALIFNREDVVFARMHSFISDTVGILLLILLAAFLVIFLLLRKSHNTLAYIVGDGSKADYSSNLFDYANDEIEYLGVRFNQMKTDLAEHTRRLEASKPYIGNQLIAALLAGHHQSDHHQALLQEYFPRFVAMARYQAVAFIICLGRDGDEGAQLAQKDVTMRLDVEQMASKYLVSNGNYSFVLYEPPYLRQGFLHFYIICGYRQEGLELTPAHMRPLQEQLRAASHTVSICIGKPVDDLRAVHRSYQDALSLEKLTFMYGLDTILDDTADYGHSATEFFDSFNLERLIKKIKATQKAGVAEELDGIFDTLSQCSYDFARLIINALFYHIMETGTLILKSYGDNELPFDLDAVYVGLEKQQTLADVKKYICRFCDTMLDTINDSHSQSRYQLFQKIVSIIQNELSDSSLSLTYLSAKLGFSSGYIGKVFSAYSECGIPEYINLKRVEKAKQLLQDTALTIEEIASSVGFQSSAYFITIFKKAYGITPNNYRKSLLG